MKLFGIWEKDSICVNLTFSFQWSLGFAGTVIPRSNDLTKKELKLCLLKILYNSIEVNFLLKNPSASLLLS